MAKFDITSATMDGMGPHGTNVGLLRVLGPAHVWALGVGIVLSVSTTIVLTTVITVSGTVYTSAQLPVTLADGTQLQLTTLGVRVLMVGGKWSVEWSSLTGNIVVTVPDAMSGQLCGICGVFNGFAPDDLTTPAGIAMAAPPSTAAQALAFSTAWLVTPSAFEGAIVDPACTNPVIPPTVTCDAVVSALAAATCGPIKATGGAYQACYGVLSPNAAYEACVNAICALGSNNVGNLTLVGLQCGQNALAYEVACRDQGVFALAPLVTTCGTCGVTMPASCTLTPPPAPFGTCRVWSSTSFQTFDGSLFSFTGSCFYVLAQHVDNLFAVYITGSSSATSASNVLAAITVRGDLKVILTKTGQVMLGNTPLTSAYYAGTDGLRVVTSSSTGSVTILFAADVGFSVRYERDGTLTVSATSAYFGKLRGLCGNFDSLSANDFNATVATLDTYVLQQKVNDTPILGTSFFTPCSDPVPLQPPCSSLSPSQAARCNIFNASVVGADACSAVVPLKPYLDQCLNTICLQTTAACALSTGYAQACAAAGRNSSLNPLDADCPVCANDGTPLRALNASAVVQQQAFCGAPDPQRLTYCSAFGQGSYVTFDGRNINAVSSCAYLLVQGSMASAPSSPRAARRSLRSS